MEVLGGGQAWRKFPESTDCFWTCVIETIRFLCSSAFGKSLDSKDTLVEMSSSNIVNACEEENICCAPAFVHEKTMGVTATQMTLGNDYEYSISEECYVDLVGRW